MAAKEARRRRSVFAAGLATMVTALGLAAIPAEAAPPPKTDYVALGDSYTAGTGAGAFSTAFPCLQTHPGGYVDVVGSTGRVNLLGNAACHGALLLDDGISPIPSVSEQVYASLPQLAAAELVSITAGANDVGFSNVIGTCVSQPAYCSGAIAASGAALPQLRAALAQTYGTLGAVAPDAKIVVLGYPRLFDPAVPVPGADPATLAALNVATDALNATIAGAVADSGANAVFVDVTSRFAGHEANSLDPWIVFNPLDLTLPQNLHPNAAGHSLGYAKAVMGAAKPAQLARQ